MGVSLAIQHPKSASVDPALAAFLRQAFSDQRAQLDLATKAISAKLEHDIKAINAQLESNNNAITDIKASLNTASASSSSLSFRLTMPEYLARAQFSFESLLPDPPRPSPTVPLKPAKDAQGQRLVPPAPHYLEHWSTFPHQLEQLWKQLDALFDSAKCMPRQAAFDGVQVDILNEGNIDTWFKFHCSQPAIRILSAAISRVRNQPLLNYDPLDPSLDWDDADDLAAASPSTLSPALASLQYAIRVVLGSQIDSAAPADRDGVDPYLWEPAPLTQSTLDMARAIPAAESRSVDESVFEARMQPHELQAEAIQLKKQFFAAIRTDQELIMRTCRGDSLSVAIIEIKKPEHFCRQHVLPALHDSAATWKSQRLRRQADLGKLPIRQALAHPHPSRACSTRARYTFECIAQLWKYMAQKGVSYGMLSSVYVTLVLHIDWSKPDPAHSARFHCFEANALKRDLADGAKTPSCFNIWHVLVAIVIWNAQTGVADTTKIAALGAKLVDDFDAFTPDNDSDTHDDSSDDSDCGGDDSHSSSSTSSSSTSSSSTSSSPDQSLQHSLGDEAGSASNQEVGISACNDDQKLDASWQPSVRAPAPAWQSSASVPYASWLGPAKVSRETHPELFFAAQHAKLNRIVRHFLRKPKPGYLWPTSPGQMARALTTFLWLLKTDKSFNNTTLIEAYMPKQVWAFDMLPCKAAAQVREPDEPAVPPSTPKRAGAKRRCTEGEEGQDEAGRKRRRAEHAEVRQPHGLVTPPSSIDGDSPDRNKSS